MCVGQLLLVLLNDRFSQIQIHFSKHPTLKDIKDHAYKILSISEEDGVDIKTIELYQDHLDNFFADHHVSQLLQTSHELNNNLHKFLMLSV